MDANASAGANYQDDMERRQKVAPDKAFGPPAAGLGRGEERPPNNEHHWLKPVDGPYVTRTYMEQWSNNHKVWQTME